MEIKTINGHCTAVYDGEKTTVFSYNTPVFSADPSGYHRHWAGWSATTLRDIGRAGFPLQKKEWEKMEVEG